MATLVTSSLWNSPEDIQKRNKTGLTPSEDIKQKMLGHSTMEMVKNYPAPCGTDLEKNHQIASPVDNWRL